jgi:hypothetical protein
MLTLFQSENNSHAIQLMTLGEMSASKILITLQATTVSEAHITGSHSIFFRKSFANLDETWAFSIRSDKKSGVVTTASLLENRLISQTSLIFFQVKIYETYIHS